MSARRHKVARIVLRYVRDEARRRYDWSGDHLPFCRGKKHEGIGWPHWNVRYRYETHSVRGGGVSLYWCDVCLPDKYRKVADSMKHGGTTVRILKGKALEEIEPPKRTPRKPSGSDRIPYGDLL